MWKRDKDINRLKLPSEKDTFKFIVSQIYRDNITIKKSSQSFENVRNFIKDDKEVNKEQLDEVLNFFLSTKNKTLIYRGKYLLQFYKNYLSNLINEVNKNNYYEDYTKKIKFDVNNDTLSVLSEYADTSTKLVEFLKNFNNEYLCEKTK